MDYKLCVFLSMIILVNERGVHASINTAEMNEIKDSLINNTLPTAVSFIPELKDFNIETGTKQVTDVFKKKCIENSGSDAAFEQASQAAETLMECVNNLIDFNDLQKEIEEAKPNGNLDTVFNKYCDKRIDGVVCVDLFTKSIDPCLNHEEKNQKRVFVNITKSILEFVCHENGNQIALFIAEEGPECFESKKDSINNCFNKTMGKYVNYELPTLENLPTLVIKEENCLDMDELEKCIVFQLEQCKESTPANLVEALFRFVRKETPCGKKTSNAHNSSKHIHPWNTLLSLIIISISKSLL